MSRVSAVSFKNNFCLIAEVYFRCTHLAYKQCIKILDAIEILL